MTVARDSAATEAGYQGSTTLINPRENMTPSGQEKHEPLLDPSNTRLWVSLLIFVFVFQGIAVPKSVMVRFIDHLLYGLFFQFLPQMTQPWKLIELGIGYLLLGWLFLRSVHRPVGTIGASGEAWKIGIPWGLATLVASGVLVFVAGGIIAGFDHLPPVFGFLPEQGAEIFKALGMVLCVNAFFQASVALLALRYLKKNNAASIAGIVATTLLVVVLQGPDLANAGLHGTALVAALFHISLIFGFFVSIIYAVTNNLVLVAMIYGGLHAVSYWTADGIYSLFPQHLFLVMVAVVSLVAIRSNPKALQSTPLAAQAKLAISHKG
jgi:hypothetical protein